MGQPAGYMEGVLEKFYEQIIDIAGKDNNTLLLNYNIGLSEMMRRLGGFTGITMNDEDEAKIAERGKYNAKYPGVVFTEENVSGDNRQPGRLTGLYEEINELAA